MTIEHVVSNGVLIQEIIPELALKNIISLDIETRGMKWNESEILLVQLHSNDDTWLLDARKLDLAPVFRVLEQTNPLIIGHNIKFDLKFLTYKYNYVPRRLYDTMIAYGILNCGKDKPYIALSILSSQLLGKELNKDIRSSFLTTYGDLTPEQLDYAAEDVICLEPIMHKQIEMLQSVGMVDVAKLEFALIPAIVDMEQTGIRLDKEEWLAVAEKKAKLAGEIEVEMIKLLGGITQDSFFNAPKHTVNVRSPKQMLFAFKELGFDISGTGADILSGIKHPLAKLLLDYRSNQKLSSTYGANFLKHLDEDDRLHPEFHSLGARSGRFSCSKPSVHNIPAEDIYRRCFIARDGYKIYSADYDQIELKVVAVLSGDDLMIEEYKKKDADLHRLTASQIFDVSIEEVTQEQRDKIGKGCNFGMVYSISEAGMAKRWGMTQNKTHEILKKFRNTYRSVYEFMSAQSDLAISQGFTTTKLGRRRYFQLPAMDSRGFAKLVAEVRREGANNVIQGTAADVIKQAIVDISPMLRPLGAHIVNTVHDELVIEAPNEVAHLIPPIIYNGMTEAGDKIVSDELKWTISLKVGNSWRK